MLKRLCCCLSLLLSLCLLFPVFSISISAISVDGYEVSTYVDTDDLADFVEFENTIVLDSSSDHLLVLFDIEFPEVIPKDTVFDLEVSFSLGDFESIEPFISGSAYDAAGNELNNDLYAVIEDGKLIESDIVAEGDIKSVRYVFVIYNPSFNYDNVDFSPDIVTDLTGTTWKFNTNLDYLFNGASSKHFVVTAQVNFGDITVDIPQVRDKYNHNQISFFGKFSSLIDSWPCITFPSYGSGSSHYPYTIASFISPDSSKATAGKWVVKEYPNLSANGAIETVYDGDVYITFTGGLDVTNSELISYIDSIASIQSFNNETAVYSFDFAITSVTVIEKDDTAAIGGIFGWIKKIFNAIRNLPNQIGDLIKGLFVPSEETIIELKDKFEALFADRFGAAYQSIEVVEQFGQAMGISTYSDTVDTITFPSVTVPLAGTEFTFGGWEVDLVPKGFEGLITPLKLIVDLVCTIACVNMFRRRMEGVLR